MEDIPEGMELVDKERFKILAKAGNDLKSLKSQLDDLPDGYDLPKLLSEFKDIKVKTEQSRMDESARLESKLSEERTKREKAERISIEKDTQIKRMKILNDSTSLISSIHQKEGKLLLQRFVDPERLASLDPESTTYNQDLVKLHADSWDQQEKELALVMPKQNVPSIEITQRTQGYSPQKQQSELLTEGMAIGMSDSNYYKRFIERK